MQISTFSHIGEWLQTPSRRKMAVRLYMIQMAVDVNQEGLPPPPPPPPPPPTEADPGACLLNQLEQTGIEGYLAERASGLSASPWSSGAPRSQLSAWPLSPLRSPGAQSLPPAEKGPSASSSQTLLETGEKTEGSN
ncbi:proline-rich protein 18-like [Suricata suricatta]|uniref:proline-rich protein 18-like n=1 Tax=Suricata suricatta TaxID=37032 RepID=UPI001156781D|nr:proline-rich protein 18-like [Suricata suricatta]XP_029812389.1 proline-rich protein 18-like [Suricata suricatta]